MFKFLSKSSCKIKHYARPDKNRTQYTVLEDTLCVCSVDHTTKTLKLQGHVDGCPQQKKTSGRPVRIIGKRK